jgi:CRP-like cAMP-binding protein
MIPWGYMHKTKPYCTDESWQGRADCQYCAIRSIVLFSVLGKEELDRALLDIDNQCFESESEVFSQDANDGYVYTVRTGCLKMVHELGDGSPRIVRMHYPGDAVGLEALLGLPYRHSAVVMQKADICRIPVGVIQALELKNPRLYEQLMRRWQASLDEAESFITDLNTGHAERRLAKLLLKLASHSERNGFPDLLREDIAAIIGVTTETASRLMADFRRRKLIEHKDSRTMKCDQTGLKNLT